MKKIQIVLDSNYGDSGKGLITDYLVSKSTDTTAVCRFSGGANAGHTVELPDGTRHVFHHFGSGTLRGAATILSKDFLVHPFKFWDEAEQLARMKVGKFAVYISPMCKITTPYDEFINQELELSCGAAAHGSCGCGINETEYRSAIDKYNLSMFDVLTPAFLEYKVKLIRDEYFPARLEELGLTGADTSRLKDVDKSFISALEAIYHTVYLEDLSQAVYHFDTLICEGSQGLLLDKNNMALFPHVTHSNTTLANLMQLLTSFNKTAEIDVCFVSRTYLTRHGNDPKFVESGDYSWVEDLTNRPNLFQGTMKFADMDFTLPKEAIQKELLKLSGIDCKIIACMSWMQWGNTAHEELLREYADIMHADHTISCFGETADDIIFK